jgi:hypothetical protein
MYFEEVCPMKSWKLKNLCAIFVGTLLVFSALNQTAEAGWGFGKDKKSARVIVVLVDMSGSTNADRRTVYRKAFGKVFEKLQGGDRLVIGTITGRSFIDFKPVVDAEIPKASIWLNRISYEQNLTQTKNNINEQAERLVSHKKGTRHTEILSSLNIADTIFHKEKRDKLLVILSDMIQDSKQYNFERAKVTNRYTSRLIKYRKKHNLIPNLRGVKVYVAGASADGAKKYRSIEKFWGTYFKVAGADYSTHRYGHSLLEFESEV